jgi:hypothetical protein
LTQFGRKRAGPDPPGTEAFMSRAESQCQGAVTVRAAVLTDDESQDYFGAVLADEGVQAVWLSVDNASDLLLHFLPVVTDPNYFSAPEVSRLVRSWWRGKANASISAALVRQEMPEAIPPGKPVSGFVFTHREGGLKFLQAGFAAGGQELLFRFVLPVGGVAYAVQKVDFGDLYTPDMIEQVDLPTLRKKLEELPSCVTDKAGNVLGDPLNLVLIGHGVDAIFPFITRGWRLDEPFDLHSIYRTIRAFLFGSEYLNAPVSPLRLFGRRQDLSLQKARNKISLRNHLRVWLAPFTIDGLQVWVAQISRDIGIKLTTKSWYLTTHRISPEVDQDRYYLLQDMIMTGAVSRFGFVRGVGRSAMPNPRTNLTGDPYVTDGLRLVLFFSAPSRAFDHIDFLDWERPSVRGDAL